MIKKLWRSVSKIGLRPEYDEKQVKRVTLINQYTFIAFLAYLVNATGDTLLGYFREGTLLACSAIVFIAALYLNKLHHHRASVISLFVYISLTIFYFGTLASVQAGDYLYYFPLVLAISFVFDFEKDKWIMVTLFVFILLLILLHTYSYRRSAENNMVSETSRYLMFVINLVASIGTVGFFIYLTIKNNQMIALLYEQRLREREQSEETIKKTLAEKEILLAELHHRVKNNLAVIVGFFNLKLHSTENEDARTILQESKNHVNSMALIHNRLYQTGNFSEINFSAYLEDLLAELHRSYPSLANTVTVQRRIENVELNLNSAVPCALILNELITNCYKHAFKNSKAGIIQIDLLVNESNLLTLNVKDNGVGLKDDFDQHDSLGINIIQGLTEQLNGYCRFYNEGGTCFTLNFSKDLL